MEVVIQVFDVWRPRVDASIEHLQTSMAQICASLPSLESPWSQYTRHDGSGHPNAHGAASILVLVKCVLHEPPLGGYDGSLDDEPESGVTYIDAPLDRAIGCVGHASVAAATHRTDAVGVVGHGLLAHVVAAGSTQATCSTIYLADDRNFADISVGALWEETMEQATTTLHPSFPKKKLVLLSSSTDGKLGGMKAYHLWFDPSVLVMLLTRYLAERMTLYYDANTDDYHNVPRVETRVSDFGSTSTLRYLPRGQPSQMGSAYLQRLRLLVVSACDQLREARDPGGAQPGRHLRTITASAQPAVVARGARAASHHALHAMGQPCARDAREHLRLSLLYARCPREQGDEIDQG
jgi:hypothetical protein